MMQVLVTGATGFVGSRLCRELVEHGYQVRVLVRPKSKRDNLSGLNIEFVEGDITDKSTLPSALKNTEIVFHIAALYREAKFGDDVYWKVNHQGTIDLFEASQRSGVKTFIHCSTIGVHSNIKNPPANESEPYAPTDVYQESKVAAEKYILSQLKKGDLRGCVIRPAMIWGPRDKRFLKFFNGIFHRRLPLFGNGKVLCHWILVDDLVRAFRLAAETPRSNGQVYIIAGQRPVTLKYTMESIAKLYGVKLLPFHIPVWPIQLLGTIVEKICKPFGIEPPIHRRRADFFIKNRAFDCSKAKEELKFEATNNFEDEVKLVGKWYLENGWLN